MSLVKGNKYTHYKGGAYVLLGVGRDANESLADVAIYQSLDNGTIWTRPAQEFFGNVETPCGTQRRFAPNYVVGNLYKQDHE